ncbi:threonine/homoserine efflux transporter RhtA [Blastococcus colisei]|uniref:Threonine/homoserine efflux transporter RhtA n=1 Tax=Blastococcus colisei TaxID=1564162 RepID=A0A543PJY1_9ACTN|nr:DMT family transporter [Blastococcus colisei]TQN44367.1 threonine/homoserine efflux transporter RhtA [Blastococcus colisei]
MKGEALTHTQLALGFAVFGSATPISQIIGRSFPTFIGSLGRMLIAALLLAPLLIGQRQAFRGLSRRELASLGLITVFGMVGFTLFLLYGLSLTTGVAASVIMATTPAMTAVGAWLFFHEALTKLKVAALVLAFAGVAVVNGSQYGQGGIGNWTSIVFGGLLVFGAVCCQALYTLAGKPAGEQLSPVQITGVTSAAAAVLFVPLALFQVGGFDASQVETSGLVALLWWGAGTLALGTLFMYSGMQTASGLIASAFTGVMPVSALVLSYVLLGEPFRWIHVLGFAVVVASIVVVAYANERQPSS